MFINEIEEVRRFDNLLKDTVVLKPDICEGCSYLGFYLSQKKIAEKFAKALGSVDISP